ncbi:regulator of cell morphogenesis and NO signaling [Virgibacillus natechei]|uniref:Regulator of cell morphogenesis and NO signaling n=1 Tax=Virgibacillus natechei TaxID=1216297 RepID=A0ABS4IG52_9BACI|nr:iron-sulfur cluster repair di-iron protein [Virgibacillus natechei]MBP1969912.1 regulator of cell morphogenesis and NO signaling [Virgibacillus natechei]UZD13423.1 iron-sulfur cluster repair di-iron protein [Virgibacillus natechei]
MSTFTAEHTPAHIVKIFPKASDLFKENQIDFCCGGDRLLKETFAKNNLDETAVLSKLNTAYESWKKEDHHVTDWDTVPLTELVDHIIYNHHIYLTEELPALGEFVTKVFRKHGSDQPHLKELHRLYHDFKVEMEEHTMKEEQEVFPLVKEYEINPSEALLQEIREANGELEEEHDATGDMLKRMRVITDGFQPHAHACGSYQITYARLAELEENTFQHIHLENNVLFKRL